MERLPYWQQLPEIELYLDQVLLYVNQITSSAIGPQEKPLTASMINNYVKQGYIPKPVKKKYKRSHLARLVVLTICKPVFPISTIHETIELLKQDRNAEELYDHFVNSLAGDDTGILLIEKACQTLHTYQETLVLLVHLEGDSYAD